MELTHMKAVIAIAECGSITAAANRLYIAPVSLMQQINVLEAELGFKVFLRTHKGCKLTEAGEMLCSGFKELFAGLDQLIGACKEEAGYVTKTIRVCLYKPYDPMRMTENYKIAYPDRSIEYSIWEPYDHSMRREWMLQKKLDILQSGYSPEMNDQALCFLPISLDRYVCFFSQESPLVAKKELTIEDLREYEVYSFSDASFVVDNIERQFSAAGCTLKRIPHRDSTVLNKCSKGAVYIMEESARSEFVYLSCAPLVPAWPCIHGIVYFSDAKRNVLDFVDYVTEQVGQDEIDRMMNTFRTRYRV